ncbi:MAG: S8 family peptidase [Bacteriovoracaceae bacterium]
MLSKIITFIALSLTLSSAHAGEMLKKYSKVAASPYTSWGVKEESSASINVQQAWKIFKKKKDILVAVIDTGVDPHHPLISKNLFRKFPTRKPTSFSFGVDFSKNHDDKWTPFDQNGHGTHISGIIKSVFPDVKLLTLKYYNPQASGYDNLNSTLKALKYAIDQNVDIINYSGGGPESSRVEYELLKEAERKGILIVAAAGNNRSDIDNPQNAYFPASYNLSNIINVTAHDQNLIPLRSSNWGQRSVHIAAPGHRILSSIPMGRFGYLSGTSQATAFVSGVAALMMATNPKLNPLSIKNIIIQTAKKEKTLKTVSVSSGRIDAHKALEVASKVKGQLKSKETSKLAKRKSAKVKKHHRKTASKNTKPKKMGRIIYRL